MPIKRIPSNSQIADILQEMSLYYAMDGIAWKPAAYQKAADAVRDSDYQMSFRYEGGGRKALEDMPGVGPAIARHIESILKNRVFSELRMYRKKYPVDILELTRIAGLGPKTVKLLYETARVRNADDLERLARRGKLHGIPGIGITTENNLLAAVVRMKQLTGSGRKFLGDVLPLARQIESALLEVPGVVRACVAGSVRRMQETIGDLDILVTTSKPALVEKTFVSLPFIEQVLERGPTKITARLQNGMLIDVRFVADQSFGAALQYFTGDKHHNVEVRKLAISKGYTLNEYGLWKGKRRIAAEREEDVYAALGLAYIPPELRTLHGELRAATKHSRGKNTLPTLLSYDAVRGDLQVQSSWTDGENTIEELAHEAVRLGREYIAITDHSQALSFAHGLTPSRLIEQAREIAKVQKTVGDRLHILRGIECDILRDGRMDLPDSCLSTLDFVGASIHSHFTLSREEQTARLVKAMRNPNVDVIFHPTGRRLLRREEYELDLDTLFKVAAETGTLLEINGSDRMDLRDQYIRKAASFGVRFLIDSDAHSLHGLQGIELGIGQARRGWLRAKDVINTLPLNKFLAWLKMPKHERRTK